MNARDQCGSTPLSEACHAGSWKSEPAEEIIRLLLDHNAQCDLIQAAAIGRTDLVESILDQAKGHIDTRDDRGRTAVFHAARINRLSVVKQLVERGADINHSDPVGIAALHRTSQQCSDKLIQYLIDQGANAYLCCHVACDDEQGTLRALANNPTAAQDLLRIQTDRVCDPQLATRNTPHPASTRLQPF